MFLGKFINLEGVYIYMSLNFFKVTKINQISLFFSKSLEYKYDYGYILEYFGSGIYCITNCDIVLYFDEFHILDINEVIEINISGSFNSNSISK